MNADIKAYNESQEAIDREICELLAAEIDKRLPAAESKIWHRHPVWFLDGNPIVGYSKLNEEHLPAFIAVLSRVQERFVAAGVSPALVEAWGDALYIVIPSARDMLRCAFVLRQAFIDRLDRPDDVEEAA